MDIEIIDKNKRSLSFTINDVDVGIANALRRAIIAEVPTLAIEDVYFMENSSSLYDEIIAHRLGLIPIKTDLEIFNFREKCKCKKEEGCANCVLKLSLDKKGPGIVYSHDLKSEDPKLKPIKNIPIVRLGKNQKITLEADAILGTGKEHAKWQAGVVSYKYSPEVEISDGCDTCGECVDACPKNILKITRKKLKVSDKRACNLCNSCVEACELDAIKVRGNNRKFLFKVESTGALEPEKIVMQACEILKGKTKEFASLL